MPSPLCFRYTQRMFLSGMPFHSAENCSSERLESGESSEKPNSAAIAPNIAAFHSLSGLKNGNAPSLNERERSGSIFFSSHSIFSPIPVHSGHAPNGLLNEKIRG